MIWMRRCWVNMSRSWSDWSRIMPSTTSCMMLFPPGAATGLSIGNWRWYFIRDQLKGFIRNIKEFVKLSLNYFSRKKPQTPLALTTEEETCWRRRNRESTCRRVCQRFEPLFRRTLMFGCLEWLYANLSVLCDWPAGEESEGSDWSMGSGAL